MKKLCSIYRSSRVDQMYLYVDRGEDLARVPETLLARFGRPELAMTLALYPGRKLARADAGEVPDAIERQGFYLQMPPTEADAAAELGLERTGTATRRSIE